MSPFLLLLLFFIGYQHSTLALDYPNNIDSIINGCTNNHQLEQIDLYLDEVLEKAAKEYGEQSDTAAFYTRKKARVSLLLGRAHDGVSLLKKVITIYEHNHSPKHIKLVPPLLLLARTYIDLQTADQALQLLDQALDIVQEVTPSDFVTVADIYSHLSLANYVSKNYNQGIEWGQKALEIHSKAIKKDTVILIGIYEHLAAAQSGLHQYENAVASQKRVLHLAQKHDPDNRTKLGSTFHGLGYYYDAMERSNEALPYYQKAVEIIREVRGNQHPETAIYINNLANCYKHLGQFKKAEPLLLEALDIFKATVGANHPNTMIFINNLGGLYFKMKDFEQAKMYYQSALDLGYKILGKDHRTCISIEGNFADALFQQGRYEEALKIHTELAERSTVVSGPNSIPVIVYYNRMAKCYLQLGADFHSQALNWVEQSIALNALEPIDINKIGNDLPALSKRIFKSNRQFQQSLRTLSKIQEAIYRNTNDQPFLLESYNTQKALAYFLHQSQKNVSTKKDKLQITKQLTAISGRAMTLIEELDATGQASIMSEAITFAEYNKSAVLSSALQGNQAINFGEIPDSLQQKEIALKKKKALAKKKIIQSTNGNNQEALKIATQDLVNAQLEQDKLRQLLQENYPKYNALKNEQKTLSTAIIQEELLNAKSALLEYCVYDSAVHVIVVTPSTVHLQQLPIEKESLQNTIKHFRKSLSDYPFIINNKQEAYVLYTQTAFDLYQALIAPIQKHLTNITELIIVPDNDLGHIPFEPLLSKFPNQQSVDYKNLNYLLHDYTICYSYATSLLLENRRYKKKTNNGKILGFAAHYSPNDSIASSRSLDHQKLRQVLEPLPAATQEIEILQELFPNGDFFFGQAANETLFKEKAANYSVLHLAMHGMVNNNYPLLSCLAFSEDYSTTENNFLEAHEISNLQLSNDLVVLSACKTGYGEFEQGEGILSLARSFMYAGTPSLVVSLWEVNDLSTAAIMQLFYLNLAQGMTKDEALRQVKLEFIQKVDSDIAHPIFWSPFIVLGDTQAIDLKAPLAPWQWGLFGGIVLVVGLVFFFFRKRIRPKELA